MVELSLQLQKHHQVSQQSRVTHLVHVMVSARTGCMLFMLARIMKALFMQSLVHYVSFTLMFMHFQIEGYYFFCNSYIAVQFSVSPITISEPLSVSTSVGVPVIARRVYRNCPVTVSQKVTSTDFIELEMVDSDVILGKDQLHSCYADTLKLTSHIRSKAIVSINNPTNEVEIVPTMKIVQT